MVRRSNAQNEIQDPSLPQKKRARWRLIGATVLALAALIVLPFALESEPRHQRSDLTVRMPERTELGKMQKVWPDDRIDVRARDGSTSIQPPASAQPPKVVAARTGSAAGPAAGAAAVIGAGAAAAGAAAQRVVEKPLPTVASPAPTSAATQSRSASKTSKAAPDTVQVVPKAAKPVPVAKKAAPAPVKAPVKKPPAKTAQKTAQNAAQNAAQNVPGQTQSRTASRANETLAALDNKKREPKPPPLPARRTDPNQIKAASPGGYVVQIGAFSARRGARAQVARAAKLGFKAYTEKITTKKGDRIRVRVGPYLSRSLANKALQKLKKAGIDTVLIAP